MHTLEIAQAFLAAWENVNKMRLRQLAAPSFHMCAVYKMSVGIDALIAIAESHKKAFPDFSFNARDFTQQGDSVLATVQVTGTHLGYLESLIPGSPAIAPTGKQIDLLPRRITLTIADDKVSHIAGDESVEPLRDVLSRQLGITPTT